MHDIISGNWLKSYGRIFLQLRQPVEDSSHLQQTPVSHAYSQLQIIPYISQAYERTWFTSLTILLVE